MTEDAAQSHFADGLVEDLLTRLQAIPGLKVISRQSAFAYKGRSVDIRTISRELGCRHVVEGSVRRIDDRMRVTVQLIDAIDDQHLWAERFDRKLTDAFELQDEICDQVVAAITTLLAPGSPARAVAEAAPAEVARTAPAAPGLAARLVGTWWAIPALLGLVAMAALLTWTWQQRSRERWAREEAIPELQALISKDDYDGRVRPRPTNRGGHSQRSAASCARTAIFRARASRHQSVRREGVLPAVRGQGIRLATDRRYAARRGARAHRRRAVAVRTCRARRDPRVRSAIQASNCGRSRTRTWSSPFKGVDLTIPLADAAATPRDMVLVPATNLTVTPRQRRQARRPARFLS